MNLWTYLLPTLPQSTADLLTLTWFGNALGDYLQALVMWVGLTAVFWFFRHLFVWRLEEAARATDNSIDDLICHLAKQAKWPLYASLALALALRSLALPEWMDWWVTVLIWISATSIILLMFQEVIEFFVERPSNGDELSSRRSMMRTLGSLAKAALWLFGILLILSNVGINVYSLVAGLGVSGIIVAFALQNVLQDLFNTLALHVDRPFELGDFVVIKDNMGTIEKIGLKSTRIRSLSGEQVVVPNSEITNSQIQNYRRMERRRVQFSLLVALDTPNTKLAKLPSAIEELLAGVEQATFNRAHLAEIEEYGLRLVVVYHVETSDYVLYRDIHQQVLLGLKAYLEQEKIAIPYPTQNVVVRK